LPPIGHAGGRRSDDLFIPNLEAQYNEEQQVIIKWAKEYERVGISLEDAKVLVELGNQSNIPSRGSEAHPNRPQVKNRHIHVGLINHIPVK
jgi:hypothetical protein